ncbi:hypothetical protein AJ78_00781 [Emergomyces pasteurianus Ep9510]|uniref:RNA polymerase I-specific transcription initiation factor RRN6-like protein n=1 Tax=Emergomyces pasteurianus Ep9510 TaxID=1447872 RepID=A0A1J9QGD2_9EURO|nr:hypothetical protein AJ78_00781 [Emergomyces pasteurianus Ep9510]
MGDHRTNNLQYGHLGRATYLPDLHVWEFARKIDRDPSLVFYGHTKCAFAAPETSKAWNKIQNDGGWLTNKNEDALLKVRPELAPALDLFRRHEATSRAIMAAVTRFDPQVSNLLAIGNAVNRDRRGGGEESTVPIAVLVHDDSATSIQFVELDVERVPWPPHSDHFVKVPTLQGREKAMWIGTSGPVQQICFAETVDEKSTWLAVRFLQSTTLFRPQRNKLALSAHYDDMDFMREGWEDSRLDANPIFDISISSTGGFPHADITFNPWYQQQIAIVDRHGNWSVWDIGMPRQSTYWHADPGPSGTLDPEGTPHQDERTQKNHYDGWAAISWVGNVHKLLVCDRRNIALYRVDVDPIQRHPVGVDIHQESEWILDVKRSQSNLSNIFVLTTTQIFWLHVNSDDFSSSSQQSDSEEITILLSWRHFRDPEDTSLQLAPLLVEKYFSLILYSRLNNMAQVFRFAFSPEDPSVPISVTDPFLLPLPSASSGDEKISEPSSDGTNFSSLIFQQIVNSSAIDPTNDSKTLRLVKCIGQRTNLEVIESLYVARADGEDEDYEPFSSTHPQRRTEKSAKWVDDDFIVDDMNEAAIPLPTVRRNWNGYNEIARANSIHVSPYGENWVDLYECASAAVTELGGSKGKSSLSGKKTQTFNYWLEDLTSNLGKLALSDSTLSSGSKTLLEILPSLPILDDIDRNTQYFEQFLTYLTDPMRNMLPPGYEITHLPMSYSSSANISLLAPGSGYTIPTNITKLYDSLVRDWLFPLPGDFPNKIRMVKEKVIRNIVIQLTLSRIVLTRRSAIPLPDPDARIAETADGNLSPSHLPSSSLWSSQQPFTQSEHPTITITSSTGQTELDTASFFPSSPQATTTAASTTPYATIRRYTSLTRPNQAPFHRRVADILSHWKVGTNPSTYNWQATVRTLRDEAELESESQSASRRRKRREARRLQRQQQQQQQQRSQQSLNANSYMPSSSSSASASASTSVPPPPASHVPVVRMPRSQQEPQQQSSQGLGQALVLGTGTGMGASTRMVQSSQVTEEGDILMTQVERGVFGGRNATSRRGVKERKKKRAAGF